MVSVNLNNRRWNHILWLPGTCILLFGLPFLLLKALKFGPDGYSLAFSAVVVTSLWFYRRKTALRLKPALNSGWALGSILAVFIGLALLSYTIAFKPNPALAIPSPTLPVILLRGVVFGVASAAAISVFPFIIVWRAFAGTDPSIVRRTAVLALAVVAIVITSFCHDLGKTGFDRRSLEHGVKKSLLTGIPTLLSGNPLASTITGAFLYSGESLISYERSDAPSVNKLSAKKPGGID